MNGQRCGKEGLSGREQAGELGSLSLRRSLNRVCIFKKRKEANGNTSAVFCVHS